MKRTMSIWKMQWKDNNEIKSCNNIQLYKESLNNLIKTRFILISKVFNKRKKCVKIFDSFNFYFVLGDTCSHRHLLVFKGI